MPIINVHKSPTNIVKPDTHKLDNGVNLIEWLYENVKLNGLGCSVFLNGLQIADSDETSPEEFITSIDFTLNSNDMVDVIVRPRGLDPVTLSIIIGVASGIVTLALVPKPEIPNQVGESSDSPNNSLNAATNQFRQRQAIPDISGQVTSVPDFLQPSYYEYINNVKTFTEVFCIGVGRHLVEGVKIGETLIDDLDQSEYNLYEDGAYPDDLVAVRPVEGVDNIEIYAPDDNPFDAPLTGGPRVQSPNKIVFFDTASISLSNGDSIDLDINWEDGGTQSLTGTFTVENVTSNSFDLVGETPFGAFTPITFGTIDNNSITESQWFTLKGDSIESIRTHITCPQGLISDLGGYATIEFLLEAELLDEDGVPTGTVTDIDLAIGGKTRNPIFRTFQSPVAAGSYRVKVTRVTNKIDDPGVGVTQLERLESVTPYDGSNFGDITILEVIRRATPQTANSSQSKISALVTRKLELFDPDTGTFDTGVYTATRSFAQYAMYLLCNQSGVAIGDIDYETLFDIEDSLTDPELGYFDFTFDDSDVGMRDRLQTVCNVARVRYYNTAFPVWNFVREEAQQSRVAMFNRRNIIFGSSSQTYKFQRDADYDSVELRYTDQTTNTESIIYKKWDGVNVVDGYGLRPIEINLAGCRNSIQAENRAILEMNKIIYQRRTVADTFMSEVLQIGIGDRIQWANPTDTEIFSGEILSIASNDFDTSERFLPVDGVTYYVNITDDSGAVIGNTAIATARVDTEYGFTASGFSTAFVANLIDNQLGSKYIIYADGESTDLTITSIGAPDDAGNATVEAVEYDEIIFNND